MRDEQHEAETRSYLPLRTKGGRRGAGTEGPRGGGAPKEFKICYGQLKKLTTKDDSYTDYEVVQDNTMYIWLQLC